jgi:hypothetical protein
VNAGRNENQHFIAMLKIFNLIIVFSGILYCQLITYDWVESLPEPWTLSAVEISDLLIDFQDQYPQFDDRLKAFTLWRVGTPFGDFMLGEEKEPDTDPIIRLDVSDCTVHVLTTLAFTQSKSWEEAQNSMEKINYKNDSTGSPVVDFSKRWHFTLDRIHSNPYTTNITESYVNKNQLIPLGITLNRKSEGSEFLALGWVKSIKTKYIPRDLVDSGLLSRLPKVVGIAFVKKSFFKLGIAIGHEGILLDQTKFVHASLDSNRTVNVDFLDYFKEGSGTTFDGILIYKFNQF